MLHLDSAEGLIAYVEWAPLPRVQGSGLIGACAFLLSLPEHRMAAATVLRQLSGRKQLQVRQAHSCLALVAQNLSRRCTMTY